MRASIAIKNEIKLLLIRRCKPDSVLNWTLYKRLETGSTMKNEAVAGSDNRIRSSNAASMLNNDATNVYICSQPLIIYRTELICDFMP